MRPITLLPLVGQELFHVVEGKMPRCVLIREVYDTTGQCLVLFANGSPWPQLVQTIDLYEAL